MAYAQSMSAADLNAMTECWNDVNDKKAMERIFTLIITEFAAIVTAGVAAYTVTTGLQSTLEGTLMNVSNNLRREHLQRWITVLVTEFTAVQTGGAGYTVTASATVALQTLLDFLNQAISYMPDALKKYNFNQIDALINTEFGLVETN